MAGEFTVLVVCTGNVHRSALAHDLLATWAGWYLPEPIVGQVRIASAGTRAPVGSKMSRTARRLAADLGAEDRAHRAPPLTSDLVESADLILTAARDHRGEVLALSPRALRRTFTIREAGRIAEEMDAQAPPSSVAAFRSAVSYLDERRANHLNPSEDDVIDPEGKDPSAAEEMVRQEVPPLVQLARVLFRMPAGDVNAYLGAVRALGSPRQ